MWRQVLEYIKLEDFEGADAAALQGPDGRARCESLRLTSHMLQVTRSQEGTIVTVKDLINLPREVHSHSFVMLVHWTSANAVLPQTKQQQPGRQVVLNSVLGAAWYDESMQQTGVMPCALQNVSLCSLYRGLAGTDALVTRQGPRDVWCVVQSFLTLYAACVKELVSLLDQCPQTEPSLEDPNGAFITPAELRIQSLVRPPTSPHPHLAWYTLD